MTKYVIMARDKKDEVLPVISADDNRCIKNWQKGGYKVIGRVKIDDGFTPVNAVVRERTE